ncbi:MAG: hypothetical protein ACRCVV_10735 [Shewanella sp.]
MDYNYPEFNPVVILRLSYLDPKGEVLGVVYLRKSSVEKFKSNVKELLGEKFDLVELNRKSNFDEYIQKSKRFTSVESDVCFMFIPFVLNEASWIFTEKLNCVEYKNTKNTTDVKVLFCNVELDSITNLQLRGNLLEPNIEDTSINPKEKLISITLFSNTSAVLGVLWCFEHSKELYSDKLKMYTGTSTLTAIPVSLSTYQLELGQAIYPHRSINDPAFFIVKDFSPPPFPLERATNNIPVPPIGSVRKLLDELSGNVEIPTIVPVKLEPIVDVEQDLKTVDRILAKYELKLTAEQRCKFLEELVKVLG